MAYEVEVPVRHRTLWLAFTDPERMAHAVPGLTVDAVQPVDASAGPVGVSGDVIAGRLRWKIGAGTITYRGTARIADAAAQDGTLDIAIDVAQVRGNGALAGYLRIALVPGGDKTTVRIVPELELSGRALDLGAGEFGAAAAALAEQWVAALAADFLEAEGSVAVPVVADAGEEVAENGAASSAEAAADTESAAAVDAAVDTETDPEADTEADPEADTETEADSADILAAAGTPAAAAAASDAPAPAEAPQSTDSPAAPEALPEPAAAAVAAPVPVTTTSPDTLAGDPFADDPLAPLWRGDVEKSPWPRVVAALGVFWLIKRRRRRRKASRSH